MMFTGSAKREPVPLTSGEILLIRRALRVYAHTEQLAIHNAVVNIKKPKDHLHAADVRQHAQKHINAAQELLDYLRTWKSGHITSGPGEIMSKISRKIPSGLKRMPPADGERSGCKVGWMYYKDKTVAEEASRIAQHNADIQSSEGYDFGFQTPGTIRLVLDDEQYIGMYEVCVP